jgi:hypothetical protein
VFDALHRLASEHGTTLTAVVNRALVVYLTEKAAQDPETLALP